MRTQTQENLIVATDSYKATQHVLQYPQGMTFMSDYLTSRGGKYSDVMPFGLQYILKHYLSKRVSRDDVLEAEEIFAGHFGTPDYFPTALWMRVVNRHDGYVPVRIRAVPEGSLVPVQAPIMQVESTDPELFFLVSWFEGLLQQNWYPTTVATLDFYTKIEMMLRLNKTAMSPMAVIPFMLHDFGFRGVSSLESARIGGGAALVNFMGTDTVPALTFLRDYYDEPMAGFSVAAAEHSTITTWGRDREVDAYRNMLKRFGNQNIVSVVSDSYNIYDAVEKLWGDVLRDEVRDMKATLVVRPDSGDPVRVVSEIVTLLDQRFGSEVNGKGYKVLNKVRVIQGDGIGHDGEIGQILDAVIAKGFSAENIVFGMGGGRLQKMDRDTQRFAIKCSLAQIDGKMVEVYKDPITDAGKRSARGYVDVVRTAHGLQMMDRLQGPHERSAMRVVFENGEILNSENLSTIRNRAHAALQDALVWDMSV